MDFIAKFNSNISLFGDMEAVRFDEERISYSELDKKSNIVALFLQKENPNNSPVLIYQNRGINFIVSILAVIKCGGCYIPVEAPYPCERLKTIISDSNATIILSEERLLSELTMLSGSNSFIDIANIFSEYSEPNDSCSFNYCEAADDNPVYIMYTSGSTGVPKGVMISYGNLLNLICSFYDIVYSEFVSPINVALISSFSFDASVKQIFCSLFYGHTLCIAKKETKYFGRKLNNFYCNNNIILSDGTPSHLTILCAQKHKNGSPVQYFLIGGENLRWHTLKMLVDTIEYFPIVVNLYGPTECCVDISYNYINLANVDFTIKEGVVPIGKTLPNNIILILDENKKDITYSGETGELCVLGKQVGLGYIGDVSENFSWNDDYNMHMYKTGDLGKFTDNGFIIDGRKDRQVKVNGNRIELEEIENAILTYNVNLYTYVSLEKDKKTGREVLIAYIFDNKKIVQDEAKVKMYLQQVLPPYMIPSKFVIIDDFPINENGKKDIRLIKERIKYEKKE